MKDDYGVLTAKTVLFTFFQLLCAAILAPVLFEQFNMIIKLMTPFDVLMPLYSCLSLNCVYSFNSLMS